MAAIYLTHPGRRAMIEGAGGRAVPWTEFFNMIQLYAHVLCFFVRDMSVYKTTVFHLKEHTNTPVTDDDKKLLAPLLERGKSLPEFFWMPATAARLIRFEEALAAGCKYPELGTQLRMLRETMEDELKNLLMLYMPPGQAAHFYAGASLLGDSVVSRFPGLASDIDEAGKCLGSGRYTAAVFHLMRVLEVGVQQFGDALGISLLDARNVEKNWHNILEEVDSAIKKLDKGDTRRPALAEISALLSAVKLAWRNEVMHPKASYQDVEAANIIGATKAFMGQLAVLV